jgi:hypothetical protein
MARMLWAAAHARPIVGVEMSTPSQSSDGFPLDLNGFVRQCAWCRRVADSEGHYRLVSSTLVHGASHGCCEACAIRFLSRGGKNQLAA